MKLIILTGALGSGKTTLLNKILEDNKQKDIGIIINEYAVIGIDKENTRKDVKEINNGCVCCTKSKDLVETIKSMKHKEYVIIETTGLTSLSALKSVMDESKIQISNLIYVVDPIRYKNSKGFTKQTLESIKKANTVIITKKDLITKKELREIETKIPNKNIITNLQDVFNLHENKIEKQNKYKKLFQTIFPEVKLDKETRHLSSAGIKSISFECKDLNKDEIIDYISSIGLKLDRAKGFIVEKQKVYKFNYATGLIYVEETTKNLKKSQIVLIGKFSLIDRYKIINFLSKKANLQTKEYLKKLKSIL